MDVASVVSVGSVVDGGSMVASFSVVGKGGLMVFLVVVDREIEREEGRERKSSFLYYLML